MLSRLRVDPFLLLLLAVLALAALLPARGTIAAGLDPVTGGAIALLFFLHGAKLSRGAILAGIGAWRLHLMVLLTTYGVFPLLGVAIVAALGGVIDRLVAMGIIYLCILPSTVQSSIAFTAIARGNVPAAVCSASLSNILGIALTPLLAAVMIGGHSSGSGLFVSAFTAIATQLLLPFVLGHLARPWVGGWIDRHKKLVMRVDRGVILLIVYTAFGAAVVEGLWTRLSFVDAAVIGAICSLLLAAILGFTRLLAVLTRQPRPDEIVLMFCGSKKSLASGVPMAGALFPAAEVGLIILPLMLFHQLQLIVCTAIAGRYARIDEQSKGSSHVLRNA
ncbi:bile acid:sodium symporter family protein [Sphingomonas sp. 37zxx]|uniref:bile acid:sodium symporter family protein n=1 Tax=Sphingomonas sp. 37zxx TaxID=1550073 RepID=UPI00053BF547|nr:bile acid:sodium symporter family protein [Sphingomonas sp. 37zxx]